MTESIRRQDASAHMPFAVCRNGRVIDLIPHGTDVLDPTSIANLREAAAAEIGVDPAVLEILVTCHKHPQSAAVDCLDCEPIDQPDNN